MHKAFTCVYTFLAFTPQEMPARYTNLPPCIIGFLLNSAAVLGNARPGSENACHILKSLDSLCEAVAYLCCFAYLYNLMNR